VLIRNGTLIDGTGAPPRRADVGIRGDRITFVGNADLSHVVGTRTIDAAGLTVSPGFIDPHTHTAGDLTDSKGKSNLPYLMQGVTTVVTNNDGGGTTDLASLFAGWMKNGIGTNAVAYIGQGSIRGKVVGNLDVAPTAAQMDAMRALVSKAMDDGSLGLSTGLYYAPGNYAKTEEVIELAKVAARKGGIYDTHMRDESSYSIGLIGSINETIRIAREANIPVHISHIKALGVDVWGQSDSVIGLVRKARAAGLDVTANQYPYTASGTSVSASLLPRWAESGGNDSLRARLNDPATRTRLVAEMTDNMRRRGGASTLLMTSTRDSTILGKTLAQIAAARGVSPIDAAIDIITHGGSGVASFNMAESDIEKFMVQDWVSTGSDGSDGHPRKYGTFPRKILEYGMMRGLMTLPEIVNSSSLRTAKAMHLQDRGVIANGMFADVIVFDARTIADRATYLYPRELATGMRYVLVNGHVAVDDGGFTGALAGRVLRPGRPNGR
jgi:N-acyl-D-aspartate/D-glutamate deacylase